MKVNEIFGPTIQGEGRSAGIPSMFLRLSGCNLACSWCDTPYTWNWYGTPFGHREKYDRGREEHVFSNSEILKILTDMGPRTKNLVITGGEPMIQQNELIQLLRMLKADDYRIEIETNGTIKPKDQFLSLIDQINCSPKTSNSGPDNRPAMRDRIEALRKLSSSDKTFFKFVISGREDLPEILEMIRRYNMRNVYLMAEGCTRKGQFRLGAEVQAICRENGFKFSPRLHVLYWDRKRGV